MLLRRVPPPFPNPVDPPYCCHHAVGLHSPALTQPSSPDRRTLSPPGHPLSPCAGTKTFTGALKGPTPPLVTAATLTVQVALWTGTGI